MKLKERVKMRNFCLLRVAVDPRLYWVAGLISLTQEQAWCDPDLAEILQCVSGSVVSSVWEQKVRCESTSFSGRKEQMRDNSVDWEDEDSWLDDTLFAFNIHFVKDP